MTNQYDRAKLYDFLIQELQDFAVFLLDLEGRITSWNPGVERFFGYTELEFIGKDVREIFTPEDRAVGAPEQEMENARREGRSSDVRWHMCRDQSRVFVDGALAAIRNESGDLCGFSKIARAVRPQHSTGSLIAAVFEGTNDPIYAVDRDGRFVFANTHAASLMGRSVDQLIGCTRQEALPPSFAAELRATDESVLRGSGPQLVEEKFPTGDGSDRVLLATKAPWRDAEQRTIGVVAIAKDITSRMDQQQDRERLLREVRRSNEELSAFSHVVAHDLRAPLRSVKTYAELLERYLEEQLDPTARQFMTFVTEGCESMEQLIESLLRYAESGNQLTASRVNVNAVIDGLQRRLEPMIRESNATITSDILPEIEADPVRLLQLFQNLLVNAINYRDTTPPRIHISAEQSADEYRFAITDNGVGIAREHFDLIFAPMTRLHTRNVPGTGVGLALCRKIVERHGGRIWVESVVGKGSTFFFTLPRRLEITPG
ncbi:MAG TPA: PAS domain S-box protein [Bryobacteraceae bacterium]|jgi:PAS domain S-box-containing protein